VTIVDSPRTDETVVRPVPRRRASMSQIVGGGVLVLIGMLWLLERTGAIDVNVTTVLALGTMVIGIALMLLAKDGPHVGLIVFGTLLGLVTLVTAVAPFEGFQGGVGDRTIAISSIEEIRPDYNLSVGTLTIDLSQIDGLGAATPLTASVGMGELLVLVPEDAEIAVDASVGAGQIEILGRVIDGVDIDETYESPGYSESSESIFLELQAFTGRVEVAHE